MCVHGASYELLSNTVSRYGEIENFRGNPLSLFKSVENFLYISV